MSARVATYNVHHCEGLDGRIDVERIASVVEATSADLVALQELDRGMARSGGKDQPAELEELLGVRVSFHPTLERGGGEYGIALATDSGGPFDYRALPQIGDEEPRGFLIGPWRGVTVVATHLSLRAGPRAAQTAALVELVEGIEGPFLLLGDLNQGPWTLRRAARGRFRVPWWPRRTMARRWAQRDHIVAGGGPRVGRRHLFGGPASDHYALAATVHLGA